MKYTYLMEPEKIEEELQILWNEYKSIIDSENLSWEKINEARAILYMTGNIYCETIAVEAIKRRLHLLKEKISLIEFFDLIDKESEKLEKFRNDELFLKLEKFYRIVKKYKNKYDGGKHYLAEEKFIKKYEEANPNQEIGMGYKGSFKKS